MAHKITINNKQVSILIIHSAVDKTVMFEKVDYIRIGSYTKKLSEYPAVQAKLWDKLRTIKYEQQIAKKDLDLNEALSLIDYSIYFENKNEVQPTNNDGIMYYMIEEGIVVKLDNGLYGITNLGAILFAKKIDMFPNIARKAVRVIQYKGNNRLEMLKEEIGNKGYAVGFEGLIKYIEALTPSEEVIAGALRKKKTAYPIVAIREAVANSLIHQDFSIPGVSPIIEIFVNRVEITNPGIPLVDINRIIDNPPKSRNEKLASLMRRLKMCEELGTGWDKIVIHCEFQHLPAPRIDLYEESIKVTLLSEIPFSTIPNEDRLWACYLHACIKHVQGEQLTNSSLRKRFGLKESSSGTASRLIRDAVDNELIKPLDPTTAPRHMKYIPVWA
ncbi:MAG: transcriptional regulator [Peptococcaceae bacterium]|nr:transcriptional regulator [Peptococcaceae bacterium]